eukprot:gene3457-55212_t
MAGSVRLATLDTTRVPCCDDEEEAVVAAVVRGTVDVVTRAGVPESNVEVLWVPDAFALTHAACSVQGGAGADAVLAVGCLVVPSADRDDEHAEHCEAVCYGLQEVALREGVPVLYGVVTCADRAHARGRAGELHHSLGMSLLHMATVARAVPRPPRPAARAAAGPLPLCPHLPLQRQL